MRYKVPRLNDDGDSGDEFLGVCSPFKGVFFVKLCFCHQRLRKERRRGSVCMCVHETVRERCCESEREQKGGWEGRIHRMIVSKIGTV